MPYYNKSSNATSLDEIRIELITLITKQLKQIEAQKELLLWINETNCYVSCHWYNSTKKQADESDNYSVVEFDELIDSTEQKTDDTFYKKILDALKTFSADSFKNEKSIRVNVFETDETNEPTRIFEIENGNLKTIVSHKKDWKSNLLEEVEMKKVFTTRFKKKRFILYFIRTILAIVLYIVFWKYDWVAWSLLVYIPLNLFSLASIFWGKYSLEK